MDKIGGWLFAARSAAMIKPSNRRNHQQQASGWFWYGDESQADRIGKDRGNGGKCAQVLAARGVAADRAAGLVGDVKVAAIVERERERIFESGAGKRVEKTAVSIVAAHGVAVLIGDVEVSLPVKCQAARIEIYSRGEERFLAAIRRESKHAGVRAEVWGADENVVVVIQGQGNRTKQSGGGSGQEFTGCRVGVERAIAIVADDKLARVVEGEAGWHVQSCGCEHAEIRARAGIAMNGAVAVIGDVKDAVSIKRHSDRAGAMTRESKIPPAFSGGRKPQNGFVAAGSVVGDEEVLPRCG